MENPKLLFLSSSESKDFMEKLRKIVGKWATTIPWDIIFKASDVTIDALVTRMRSCDATIVIAKGDDKASVRDNQVMLIRDNLLFEMGLSYGILGKTRTYIVCEKGIKIPSDICGVTYIQADSTLFENSKDQDDERQALENISNEIKSAFQNSSENVETQNSNGLRFTTEYDVGDRAYKELRSCMLNGDVDGFTSTIKTLEHNEYLTANNLYNIAILCRRMRLQGYARTLLDYAHQHFPDEFDISIAYIDELLNSSKKGDVENALSFVIKLFAIDPDKHVFTEKSKNKQIYKRDYIITIFNTYLSKNYYEQLLDLINSYELLYKNNIHNSNLVSSYKAIAKKESGDLEGFLEIYRQLIGVTPDKRNINLMSRTFYEIGDDYEGYVLGELSLIMNVDGISIITFVDQILENGMCRIGDDIERVALGRDTEIKNIVVPLLYKAISYDPNNYDVIKEVKERLRRLGGKREFDEIIMRGHSLDSLYEDLRSRDIKEEVYVWDTIDYIEKMSALPLTEKTNMINETVKEIARTQEGVSNEEN